MQFLDETYAMRGAMLLDVDRLIRLEPDKKRGIRATNMDQERMKGTESETRRIIMKKQLYLRQSGKLSWYYW